MWIVVLCPACDIRESSGQGLPSEPKASPFGISISGLESETVVAYLPPCERPVSGWSEIVCGLPTSPGVIMRDVTRQIFPPASMRGAVRSIACLMNTPAESIGASCFPSGQTRFL
jgi:hypothetical protein